MKGWFQCIFYLILAIQHWFKGCFLCNCQNFGGKRIVAFCLQAVAILPLFPRQSNLGIPRRKRKIFSAPNISKTFYKQPALPPHHTPNTQIVHTNSFLHLGLCTYAPHYINCMSASIYVFSRNIKLLISFAFIANISERILCKKILIV